jgi:hypothetical protein
MSSTLTGITVFLLVLSPLYIPIGVTIAHLIGVWRAKSASMPVRGGHTSRRPATGQLQGAVMPRRLAVNATEQ